MTGVGIDVLEGWVAEYQPVVYRAAVLIVHDRDAAEDIAQETFLRAYRAAGKLGPDANVRGWLYRIATNLALNHLRSRGRERRAVERLGTPEPGDDMADRHAGRTDVAHALVRLPDHLRIPVILRYYLDLSERDIARALRVPPGTVKSRLHEARRQLAGDPALAEPTDELIEEVEPR